MKQTQEPSYRVLPGPEGLLPPAAAIMGIRLPEEGEGLVEGRIVTEEKAMEAAAAFVLTRAIPILVPTSSTKTRPVRIGSAAPTPASVTKTPALSFIRNSATPTGSRLPESAV